MFFLNKSLLNLSHTLRKGLRRIWPKFFSHTSHQNLRCILALKVEFDDLSWKFKLRRLRIISLEKVTSWSSKLEEVLIRYSSLLSVSYEKKEVKFYPWQRGIFLYLSSVRLFSYCRCSVAGRKRLFHFVLFLFFWKQK